MITNKLKSKYIENFNNENPLSEYPRPQLQRDSYLSLNGKWKYVTSSSKVLPSLFKKEIIVPFCIESELSGVGKQLNKNEYIYYYKELDLKGLKIKDKILLNFMAVDCICDVFVNKEPVCHHEGGYLPFSVDIKPYLKNKKNELIVRVLDNLDRKYPYGKQSLKRGGMWYTPVSGIWQSVFLESVSNDYIKNITINTDVDHKTVSIIAESNLLNYNIEVFFKGKKILKETSNTGFFKLYFENINLWSPEEPNLYEFVLSNKKDEVKSYFGFKKFEIKDKLFYLNDKPIFLNGVLDQGYFSDGIYTPNTYKLYEDDILYLKSLGFNCLRKHIKVEPLYFYYLCDKLGILVLQDMVQNGDYHYLRETVIPTIGFQKKDDTKTLISKDYKDEFIKESCDLINHLYNVVSICYYTVFNEGWGQFESDRVTKILKKMDDRKIYDSTSGWFWQKESDLNSYHFYFKKCIPTNYDKLNIISEFGGYVYKLDENSFNLSKTYGYKIYNTKDDFIKGLKELYENEIIANISKFKGAIYTQLSDVEDETNGLVTYDRKVYKITKEDIGDLFKPLKEDYHG